MTDTPAPSKSYYTQTPHRFVANGVSEGWHAGDDLSRSDCNLCRFCGGAQGFSMHTQLTREEKVTEGHDAPLRQMQRRDALVQAVLDALNETDLRIAAKVTRRAIMAYDLADRLTAAADALRALEDLR